VTDRVEPPSVEDDAASSLASAAALVAAYVALLEIAIFGAAGVGIGPVRAVAGLVVGLFAPGWLLLRATAGQRLAAGHAAALMVPMSLAICALSGTVLTLAGVKLTPLSLTIVVSAVSLVCLRVAAGRRMLVPPLAVRRPAAQGLRLTPRTAIAAVLAIAIIAVAASTVRQIVGVDDAARVPTPFVALTGELQQITPVAGGVSARVGFTTINNQPRTIRPLLVVSVVPSGTTPVRRTLTVGPRAQASVQESLPLVCGNELVATLSGDGVPARTSTLRIPCAP
jgi:hypothetical protein